MLWRACEGDGGGGVLAEEVEAEAVVLPAEEVGVAVRPVEEAEV